MPTKMELVKRPRVSRRTHPLVRGEVKHAYDVLGKAAIGILDEDVANWEGERPTFTYKVTVSQKRWTLTIKYDARTTGGKKYKWVSEGTASYAGRESYIIRPKNQGGVLSYELPDLPKSLPASGIPSPSSQSPPGFVLAGAVVHPGIDPRKFGEDLYKHLKSRQSGSFHNVTEAAIKRAFRKLDIPV